MEIFEKSAASRGIAAFNGYLDKILADKVAGEKLCFEKVALIHGQDEAARIVIRICFGVSEADGHVDSVEREKIVEICTATGIALTEFGLAVENAEQPCPAQGNV